jgi:hypothetical protein
MDHATAANVIAEMHNYLIRQADVVFYSGRKLFEEETGSHPKTKAKSMLLEQGVDYDHFATATSMEGIQPNDLAGVPHPSSRISWGD